MIVRLVIGAASLVLLFTGCDYFPKPNRAPSERVCRPFRTQIDMAKGVEPKVILVVYDSQGTLDRETREVDIEVEVGMRAASSGFVKAQPFFPQALAEAEENPWIKSWPLAVSQQPTASNSVEHVILDAEEKRFRVKLSGPFALRKDAPPITNDMVCFSVRYDHNGIISNPVRFNLTLR